MSSTRFNLKKVSANIDIAEKSKEIRLIRPNFEKKPSNIRRGRSINRGAFTMTPLKRVLIRKIVSQMQGVTIDEATSKAITEVMKGNKTTI